MIWAREGRLAERVSRIRGDKETEGVSPRAGRGGEGREPEKKELEVWGRRGAS